MSTETFLDYINTGAFGETHSERMHCFIKPVEGIWKGSNTAQLEVGTHCNGSGEQAFGGAKNWPHITLGIGLPADTSKAEGLAIIKRIHEMLPKIGYIEE